MRRGEASILERLIRTHMEVQKAQEPSRDDVLELVMRELHKRLPAMRAARERFLEDGAMSGLVIDADVKEVPLVVVEEDDVVLPEVVTSSTAGGGVE